LSPRDFGEHGTIGSRAVGYERALLASLQDRKMPPAFEEKGEAPDVAGAKAAFDDVPQAGLLEDADMDALWRM
jgi:hypothetical protein